MKNHFYKHIKSAACVIALAAMCLLTVSNAWAQTELFYKYYDIQGVSGLTSHAKIIQSSDKVYYYVAFVEYDTNLVAGGYYSNNLIYSKLTADGSVIWTKKISDTGDVHYLNATACALPADGFLISYIKTGPLPPYDSAHIITRYSSVVLLQGDDNGNITHNHIYIDSVGQTYPNVFMDDGAPYLSYGSYSDNSIRLIKFDLNLNQVWEKAFVFSFRYSPELRFAMSTSNNNIVMVGENFGYANITHGTLMLNCDENGNLNWIKDYETASADYDSIIVLDINGGMEDNDHNFVFVGTVQTDAALMLKISPTGELLFFKLLSDNASAEAYDILPDGSSHYMLVAEPEFYPTHCMAAMAQVDYSGNINWMKIYGDTAQGTFPYGAVLNADSTYTVFGIESHFGPPANIMLMKINQLGEAACPADILNFNFKASGVSLFPDTASCTISTLAFDSSTQFVPKPVSINSFLVCDSLKTTTVCRTSVARIHRCAALPQPGDTRINLTVNGIEGNYQIKIYNVMGQTIGGIHQYAISGNETIPVDISNLAQGTYQLVLMNDKEYYSKPFVHIK